MKTAQNVIDRILWDPTFDRKRFSIGYIDRFKGVVEEPFSKFYLGDLASAGHFDLAIPEHRIQFFKRDGVKVWDKNEKLDRIFGNEAPESDLVQDKFRCEMKPPIEFCKFISIENFHNVVKNFSPHEFESFEVTFVPKIKLHGTNAGYVVDLIQEQVFPMKRSKFIDEKTDNFGFAKWAMRNRQEILKNAREITISHPDLSHFTVWGEWCGKKIQKGVALSNLDENIFCPFEVVANRHIWDPKEIEEFVPKLDNLFVIETEPFLLKYEFVSKSCIVDEEENVINLEQLNQKVAQVDSCDPWVKKHFDIEGPGEGLVLFPIKAKTHPKGSSEISELSYDQLRDRFLFKAKGEKHRNANHSVAVSSVVEKVSREEFAEKFLTKSRFDQALENTGEPSIESLGEFLKWIKNDILKESKDDLSESGLVWMDVQKLVTERAKIMYLEKLQ